ncbi:alpha/beta fold hydrolase [Streptomyces sp. NBC_00539]|uniref:alpha/beta fold hydrolase n=1 Tax=Streptomyces sp. NBC_00539 TaxID=2975770 RepID=UPI003FCC9C28
MPLRRPHSVLSAIVAARASQLATELDSWRSAGAPHGQVGRWGSADRPPERKGRFVFEEFATRTVRTTEASVFVRYGGEGPPLLLLHGHPRTSATWHRVAPVLVRRGFSVVCPDLRGYGRSRGPAPARDHVPHSKRAVAKDMVEVMQTLGHQRFGLVGHDRGVAVALRLVLDHPSAVTRVAFLDGLPLSEHLTVRMPGSPPRGGTGSSSPSRRSPNASSTPIPTPGTAATPKPWGRKITTSGGPPPAIQTSSAPCWRTTAPGSPWTANTRRRTAPEARGSTAPSWSCGRYATIWRTCTATRAPSGATGPTTSGATASTPATMWPRKPPARSPPAWATSSS